MKAYEQILKKLDDIGALPSSGALTEEQLERLMDFLKEGLSSAQRSV